MISLEKRSEETAPQTTFSLIPVPVSHQTHFLHLQFPSHTFSRLRPLFLSRAVAFFLFLFLLTGSHDNYFVRNGIQWNTIHLHSSLKTVSMKVRPTDENISNAVVGAAIGRDAEAPIHVNRK